MIIAIFFGPASSPDRHPGSDADMDIVEIKEDEADLMGYAYVGSHNFTPSAWGTLSGSGFTPVLNVRRATFFFLTSSLLYAHRGR
jgi:tyrosyl-DNA phosphodiesterase-1